MLARLFAALCMFVVMAPVARTASIVITFEGFADSTVLANQYPLVTFGNAIILTAQYSLDEAEFPPRSGVNVASDLAAPLSINFLYPTPDFTGYFTYSVMLTLRAYNSDGQLLDTKTSSFDNNELVSGDAGSAPNERVQFNQGAGIKTVLISGADAGGSFAMDDVGFTTPEPECAILVLASLLGLRLLRQVRQPGSRFYPTRR